jgi:hypothetical protein
MSSLGFHQVVVLRKSAYKSLIEYLSNDHAIVSEIIDETFDLARAKRKLESLRLIEYKDAILLEWNLDEDWCCSACYCCGGDYGPHCHDETCKGPETGQEKELDTKALSQVVKKIVSKKDMRVAFTDDDYDNYGIWGEYYNSEINLRLQRPRNEYVEDGKEVEYNAKVVSILSHTNIVDRFCTITGATKI